MADGKNTTAQRAYAGQHVRRNVWGGEYARCMLAYPAGKRLCMWHGVSNAVLLPHVLEFNLPAAPDRYATIAVALGC